MSAFPFPDVDTTTFLTAVGGGLLSETAGASDPELLAARARFKPIHQKMLILNRRGSPAAAAAASKEWFKAMSALLTQHLSQSRHELRQKPVVDLAAYRRAH